VEIYAIYEGCIRQILIKPLELFCDFSHGPGGFMVGITGMGLGSSVHRVLACQSEDWGFDPRSGHFGCTLVKGALPAFSSVHFSCN